jgi:hypothetical protein
MAKFNYLINSYSKSLRYLNNTLRGNCWMASFWEQAVIHLAILSTYIEGATTYLSWYFLVAYNWITWAGYIFFLDCLGWLPFGHIFGAIYFLSVGKNVK